MSELVRTLVADRGDAGQRVDLVIRRHLLDVSRASRTQVQHWIEQGRVTINGTVVTRVAARTAAGDSVVVHLPAAARRAAVLPEEGDLECLYEDEDLLIVNKPAGVVSHPTFRHPEGSLLNVLLWYARAWPESQRPSLVGRLDKLTSGLVVVAKSTAVHARLQRILASARSEKRYLAVAYGPMAHARVDIDLPLKRDPNDRRRVVATQGDGFPSLTHVERLAQIHHGDGAIVLASCRLATGRMHQIRVHMAARGWPLVGDPKYGEPRWTALPDSPARDALEAFPRQALHAWKVSFAHPSTGTRIEVIAPLPLDLRDLMDVCQLALPEAEAERSA
ncbi:MAG: RluA family pseudouridine synthase [Vicinamibacterales bacterium]